MGIFSERPELHFVSEKEPHRDEQGRKVYDHARELLWESAEMEWDWRNRAIREAGITINDCQVVILPHAHDVSMSLFDRLKRYRLNDKPVAYPLEEQYTNDEWRIDVEGADPRARSVYIIGSLVDEWDFMRAMRVAHFYRHVLNAEVVTLVTSFMPWTREEKNIDENGAFKYRTLSLNTMMAIAPALVHRWIGMEPHSSATQAEAEDNGISYCPVTPYMFMGRRMLKRAGQMGISRDNIVIVRPDSGRNLAACRFAEDGEFPSVAFDKRHINGSDVEVLELPPTEVAKVVGKTCLMIDDVASSMKTMDAIAMKLEKYEALGVLACLMHCEFTPGWQRRIESVMYLKILGSNSREPIGNMRMSKKIEVADWSPLIAGILRDDMNLVNFWGSEKYNGWILQQRPKERGLV